MSPTGLCPVCLNNLGKMTAKLEFICAHVEQAGSSIKIIDLEVGVGTFNKTAVMVIDGTDRPGWHRSIQVRGPIKCLGCDGLTYDQVLCDDCSKAVAVIREVGAKQLVEIGKAIHNSGLAELAEAVTKGLLTDWIANQMKEMESR